MFHNFDHRNLDKAERLLTKKKEGESENADLVSVL